MYGLVNRALQELVVDVAGKRMWRTLCREVGYAEMCFEDLKAYPDKLTYDLVGAASLHLETPAEDLLRSFGRHWVLFTARSRYADLLDEAGHDLESFLHGLDGLHRSVEASMPELKPPSIGVEDIENGLLVYYGTERAGLEPMVIGLLEGLLEHFCVDGAVEQVEDTAHGEHVFRITFSSL